MAYIEFEYGTKYATTCYGGIEHYNCGNDAVYTELEDGKDVSCVCERCKEEIETYIQNKVLSDSGNGA